MVSICVRKISWRREWHPLQYSRLKKSMDRGHYQLKNVVWGTQSPPWNPTPWHGHTITREPVRGVPGSWHPLDILLYM